MKKFFRSAVVLGCVVALLGGCKKAAMRRAGIGATLAEAPAAADSTDVRADRMLVWRAYLHMDVANVSGSVAQATAVVQQRGGYVERHVDNGKAATVLARIPSKNLETALGSIEELGTVTYRHVEAEDVTEEYVDVQARLKNKIVLRDRLQQLLDKATSVKDTLAIEAELNRVQADADAMEARIKSLGKQVDYATVELNFRRKPIPGPLGFVFKGLWWCIEKLFVIRD